MENHEQGWDQEQQALPHEPPTHFVGIGASAGGLEAIEAFFSAMPARSGLAFIVIQHLSPHYKSMMVELLSKKTSMEVLRAEEGMRVEADRIYLLPPRKNLTIFHGKLLLSEQDHSRGINLPIDVFFRSLAEDQGEKTIGIILSGTGSDGTRGVRGIKESGGIVMVQDEDSAKFDGMPRSVISTGLADFVLSPGEMPKKLLSIIKHPFSKNIDRTDQLLTNEDAMTRIFSLLRTRTKVDFTFYKPSTVVRRIERRMAVNQVRDLNEYARYLETYSAEVTALYRDLLIGVTNFFRDREVFDALGTTYLEDLFAQKAPGQDLRFWVAGCSTGEEPYSLAILSREVMRKMGRNFNLKIFATDIDSDSIAKASAGIYSESIAADLPPQLLSNYFQCKDDNFRISQGIREMVVFARHNLVKDPPFTNIDLISCRNLLIYFQPVLQRKVFDNFNFSLNPKGVLLLGTSESTGDSADFFEPLDQKLKIFVSRGKRKPAGFLSEEGNLNKELDIARRSLPRHPLLKAHEEERVLERYTQALLGDYLPVSVVVNSQMEVLHTVGDTSAYFRLPSGRMQNDVAKMAVPELTIPLTTGISKAFKIKEEIRFSNIRLNNQAESRLIQVLIKPLSEKKGQEPLVAVLFSEVSQIENSSTAQTQVYEVDRAAEQRVIDLEQELQFTRENLQATIEELETSNEELQATNEELLASNEELQSTNEELQSVNEELHTVNAEYQSKIMELTELNNDVDNLLTAIDVATIFLGEAMEIRKFTPKATEIFKIISTDLGRPFNHLTHNIENCDLNQLVEKAKSKHERLELEVMNSDARWYLLKIFPYLIGPTTFAGLVLTFVDISLTKRVQKKLEDSQERNNMAQKAAHMGYWDWNLHTDKIHWSESAEPIFGLALGSFGKSYHDYLLKVLPEDRSKVETGVKLALQSGQEIRVEHRILGNDQEVQWALLVGQVVLDSQYKPVRVLGMIQNISHSKAMASELQIKETAFGKLFDHMLHGAGHFQVLLDQSGQVMDLEILAINPSLAQLLGKPATQLKDHRLSQVLPELRLEKESWIQRLGQVALTGKEDNFITSMVDQEDRFRITAYSPVSGQVVAILEKNN